jgi:hypothetical protein
MKNCFYFTYFLYSIIVDSTNLYTYIGGHRDRMVVGFITTSDISIISWWSVLLMEETRVPRENHRPTLSH